MSLRQTWTQRRADCLRAARQFRHFPELRAMYLRLSADLRARIRSLPDAY